MSQFKQTLVMVPHPVAGSKSEVLYMVHGFSQGGVDPALVEWLSERGRTLQFSVNQEAGIHLKGLSFYMWLDDPIYEQAAIEFRVAWDARFYKEGEAFVCP